MIRPIVKDIIFLGVPSENAGKEDIQTVFDLIDTLKAHKEECVGMAANMIGIRKNIIVFSINTAVMCMLNPVIVKKSGSYETEEGCLSLQGTRKTVRWQKITVEYLDAAFKKKRTEYSGYTAQIIQHEIDHCKGIII